MTQYDLKTLVPLGAVFTNRRENLIAFRGSLQPYMKQFNLETQAWEGEEETRVLNSLEFLQSVYRDDQQPLTTRIRCAVEALPFEKPKLQAIAHFDGNFAEQLDKAIEARSMKLIEAKPVPEQHPPEELRGPMERLRRF